MNSHEGPPEVVRVVDQWDNFYRAWNRSSPPDMGTHVHSMEYHSGHRTQPMDITGCLSENKALYHPSPLF